MEASALTHAGRRGLLARRTPLLKLQGDERLISLVRDGNPGAFDTIVDRYQSRLLGFCRQMLRSTEDAEDVLQEVFVNAYRAMLADSREINLRPWLYRIARNRCLNHLRRPTADAQESMDAVPMVEAGTTHERVHNREEFRQLLTDVSKLPETQRSALLLREMDAMSYEEIAHAMDTTVPSVKSLLVRARISLAEASQARLLTCGEVRLELAEAAEGLAKASGPVRRHVRDCEECSEFRSQIRSDSKVLAALSPIGPLVALKAFLGSKLGFGGGGAAGAGAAGGAGATGAGTFGGGALAGGAAGGGLSAVTSAVGAKAVAGVVTAAVLTAGAVEVKHQMISSPAPAPQTLRVESFASGPDTAVVTSALPMAASREAPAAADSQPLAEPAPVTPDPAPAPEPAPAPAPAPDPAPAPAPAQDPAQSTTEAPPATGVDDPQAAGSSSGSTSVSTTTSPHPSGQTAVVTVGDPAPQGSTGTPEPPPTPPTAGGGGSTDPAGPPPAG